MEKLSARCVEQLKAVNILTQVVFVPMSRNKPTTCLECQFRYLTIRSPQLPQISLNHRNMKCLKMVKVSPEFNYGEAQFIDL